jgi:hypothetical protein
MKGRILVGKEGNITRKCYTSNAAAREIGGWK